MQTVLSLITLGWTPFAISLSSVQLIIGLLGLSVICLTFVTWPLYRLFDNKYIEYIRNIGSLLGLAAFLVIVIIGVHQYGDMIEKQHRAEDRKAISSRLKTMNALVTAEEEYYARRHNFSLDIDQLYLTSTDQLIRDRLRPLAVDGLDWQYFINYSGPFSLRSDTIKIDTGYLSSHFSGRRLREDNKYSIYLRGSTQGFNEQRICSAHYFCVKHLWVGVKDPF